MSDLKDFVIEKGVLLKYVGKGSEVVIPGKVKEIGGNAFYDCKSLKSVTIGDNVTYVWDGAFRGCSKLESITVVKKWNGDFLRPYRWHNRWDIGFYGKREDKYIN